MAARGGPRRKNHAPRPACAGRGQPPARAAGWPPRGRVSPRHDGASRPALRRRRSPMHGAWPRVQALQPIRYPVLPCLYARPYAHGLRTRALRAGAIVREWPRGDRACRHGGDGDWAARIHALRTRQGSSFRADAGNAASEPRAAAILPSPRWKRKASRDRRQAGRRRVVPCVPRPWDVPRQRRRPRAELTGCRPSGTSSKPQRGFRPARPAVRYTGPRRRAG